MEMIENPEVASSVVFNKNDNLVATPSTNVKTSLPKDAFKSSNFPAPKNISKEEYDYYLNLYPTVNLVLTEKPCCTICETPFDWNKEMKLESHPILLTAICSDCLSFYESGDFGIGDDGYELYCRWCGQGGDVYCCASCSYVFCEVCLTKHFPENVVQKIKDDDNWKCLKCDPQNIYPLRARYWAFSNYLETIKRHIASESVKNAPAPKLDSKLPTNGGTPNTSTSAKLVNAPKTFISSVNKTKATLSRTSFEKIPALSAISKQSPIKQQSGGIQRVLNQFRSTEPQRIASKVIMQQQSPNKVLEKPIILNNKGSKIYLAKADISSQQMRKVQSLPYPNKIIQTSVQAPKVTQTLVGSRVGVVQGKPLLSNHQNSTRQFVVVQNQLQPTQKYTLNGRQFSLKPIQPQPQQPLKLVRPPIRTLQNQQPTHPIPQSSIISNAGIRISTPVRQGVNIIRQTNQYPIENASSPRRSTQIQRPLTITGVCSLQMPQHVHSALSHLNIGPRMLNVTHNFQTSSNQQLSNAQFAMPNGPVSHGTSVANNQPVVMEMSSLNESMLNLRNRNFDALAFVKYLNAKYSLLHNKTLKNNNSWDDIKSLYTNLELMSKHAIHWFQAYVEKCRTDNKNIDAIIAREELNRGDHPEDDEIEVIEPIIESVIIDSDVEDNSVTTENFPTNIKLEIQEIPLKRNLDNSSGLTLAKKPRQEFESVSGCNPSVQNFIDQPQLLQQLQPQNSRILTVPDKPKTKRGRKPLKKARANRLIPFIKLRRLENIYTNFAELLNKSKARGLGNVVNLSELCVTELPEQTDVTNDESYFDPMLLCTTVMETNTDNEIAAINQIQLPLRTPLLSSEICNPSEVPPTQLLADQPRQATVNKTTTTTTTLSSMKQNNLAKENNDANQVVSPAVVLTASLKEKDLEKSAENGIAVNNHIVNSPDSGLFLNMSHQSVASVPLLDNGDSPKLARNENITSSEKDSSVNIKNLENQVEISPNKDKCDVLRLSNATINDELSQSVGDFSAPTGLVNAQIETSNIASKN